MPKSVRALVLASCFVFVHATVAADDFSWELAGAAAAGDQDPYVDTNVVSLGGTYYFDPVDDSNGPYALATFYDPVTRMSVGASHEKRTISPFFTLTTPAVPELVSTLDSYDVGGRYVLPKSRWYAGGRYSRRYLDETPAPIIPSEVDSDGYGFLVGKYLGPKTLLELHADRSDERRETSSFACFPLTACVVLGSIETRRTTDVLAVDARHVRRFRGLTYSLSGSVAETNTDYEVHQSLVSPFPTIPIRLPPGAVFTAVGGVVAVPLSTDFSLGRYRSYAAAVDFYPTAKIGAHAGYSRYDGDLPPAEDAYDVGATWFVTRQVGLRFGFARQRAPKGFAFGDVDTATLGVTGRF